MRTLRNLLFTWLVLFAAKPGNGQSMDLFKKQLVSLNATIANAFRAHDEKALLNHYQPGAILMPEYHKPLYGKDFVRRYFRQWFANTTTKLYERTIVEVQQLGDHLSEIGTFTHSFNKRDGTTFTYIGKYMVIWKIDPGFKLSIVSEIWGSDVPIDAKTFSFISPLPAQATPQPPTNAIASEVGARNALIAKLVTERRGDQHALLFMNDAIYLTYDTSMLVGIKNIRPYFLEHEKPDAISIDSLSIRASKLIDLGNYLIEYGYYYVDVSWDNKKGGVKVTGKSTNLWKRNGEGVLMLYRQMVNHD